jgi:hypothetical protein
MCKRHGDKSAATMIALEKTRPGFDVSQKHGRTG